MHDLTVSSTALPRTFAASSARHLPPTFGLLLGRLLARFAVVLRRRARQARQRRRALAIERSLRELGARELHDIGLHSSEIASVAAEMSGAAEITRIHVARSSLPGC